MSLPPTTTAALTVDLKPRDEDLDLFGLTHQGLVRSENQDHFLIGTLHRQLAVHGTSLPSPDQLPLRGERFATFAVVADGVGGSAGGAAASRLAVETIAHYVQSTLRCFSVADPGHEPAFGDALRDAALEAHDAVRGLKSDAAELGPATTLTLAIGVWPRAYVVQVGDSRCYAFGNGALRRLTRDQTVAQNFVDSGTLSPEQAARSPYQNVLVSAIGGRTAAPVVTPINLRRDAILLLCSDGLTKHVEDSEVATCLGNCASAEQACQDLLRLALERGGHDNITIVIGRVRRPS
ncbi:MAG TPA: protein phosphatase 2C domain-containing protein [Gemmatimonadales bacterium]|nr:protein phosphatase 2C domain-containing protein [Gemmatimonadales bacterium]